MFNINTIYYLYMNMVQKYDEFFSEDVQLNEAQEKMINEAAEVIAEKIRNGEEVDEGLFGSLVGGLAGATVGPAIGRAICKALGITSGLLYDLFNSRMFTTAVATYIGYKNEFEIMTEVKSNTPLQDFPGIYNGNNNELLQRINTIETEVRSLKAVRNADIEALRQSISTMETNYRNTIGQIKAAYDATISELKSELVEIGNRLTALENKSTE